MAVTRRPVAQAGLFEPSGAAPLWRTVPSWFVFGELDPNIPVGAHRIMAERAGSRRTVEIAGASHVMGASHPGETVQIVLLATTAVAPVRSPAARPACPGSDGRASLHWDRGEAPCAMR